jgi:hypothetical protein
MIGGQAHPAARHLQARRDAQGRGYPEFEVESHRVCSIVSVLPDRVTFPHFALGVRRRPSTRHRGDPRYLPDLAYIVSFQTGKTRHPPFLWQALLRPFKYARCEYSPLRSHRTRRRWPGCLCKSFLGQVFRWARDCFRQVGHNTRKSRGFPIAL